MRSPRLYVETPLACGTRVELPAAAAHYLLRVLRLGRGAGVRLFNARDGEWSARIDTAGRDRVQLAVEERLRPPPELGGPTLFVAPPRRSRFEWLVEKATELGVGRIVPVATRRGVAKPERMERLRAIAVEAAEQCGRLDVPEIEGLCPFDQLLERLREGPAMVADETGGEPLLPALARSPRAAFVVGPEGGFAAEEREALRALAGGVGVSLGPRILRTETAAVAMLACWVAVCSADRGAMWATT
ncbi:Ribosomal RNA small subunit methyltransferase E [bacterium HR40]|nr:Ribosomal RNA small subunit methyltransferase E [bacterium HR40]